MPTTKFITLANLDRYTTHVEEKNVQVTRDEYTNLPSSKLTDNRSYFIEDEGIVIKNGVEYGGKSAEDTTYSLSVGTGEDVNKIVLTPSTGNPDKITVPYAVNAGTVNGHSVAVDVPSDAEFTDTTYEEATTSTAGLLSSADKTKLNNLGTASYRDIPTSGDASTSEVVLGSDSRLTNARNAADVYDWAKAATKPSYTAAEVGAIAITAKGANDGVAELDSTGKVPSSQLPSYVDDILEYDSISDFPLSGETGKIYIAKDTNKTYRWSGSGYIEISESLALGETSSTAYAGNKGKANADAIAAIKDGSTIDSFSDVETALAGKQGTITAGLYIQKSGDTISVKRDISQEADEVFFAEQTNNGLHVVVTVGSTTLYEENFVTSNPNHTVLDLVQIRFNVRSVRWIVKYLKASKTQSAGYETIVWPSVTDTFVTTVDSDKKLIIQSELDTALSGKQDTLTFDNAPTENSNNPVKSGGVYSALAGKQGTLTAGDYINLNNGNISVNRNLVGNNYDYEIKSTGDYKLTIIKSQGGTVISTNTYDYSYGTSTNIDNNFTIAGGYSGGNTWVYTALKDSTTHSTGYTWTKSVEATFEETEAFPSEDLSGYKLVIKSEMDTALAGKVNTENGKGLSTNDYSDMEKAQVATNTEDVSKLKSGFTNLDNEVNGDATTYDYADVITIPDAVPSNLADCSVKIEPVQDLHGYDKPWVGGAGDNKYSVLAGNDDWGNNLDATHSAGTSGELIIACGSNENSGVYSEANSVLKTEIVSLGTCYVSFDISASASCSVKVRLGDETNRFLDVTTSKTRVNQQITPTNGVFVFYGNGNAVDLTISNFMISTTSGEVYKPYTNICPISGHTEVDVQRGSGNLLDENVVFGQGAEATNYYTVNNDGSVTVLQSDVREYPWLQGVWLDKGTYTFSRSVANGTCAIADLTKNETIDRSNTTSLTFTLTERTYVGFKGSYYGNYPFTAFFKLERGETATPYVPYVEPQTYTIALGSTIYGGTVDFDSGVMTVTQTKLIITGNESETWSASGEPGWHQYTLYKDTIKSNNIKCNMFVSMPISDRGSKTGVIVYGDDNLRFALLDSDMLITTLGDWKTWVSNNNIEVTVDLATPTTIQLTPQQIQLLKGQNTLTASTGQISVTVNGVSGAIGSIQTQTNELANSVESRLDSVESIANVVNFRTIATSETSGTLADKLDSLWSAFYTLSDDEKKHAFLYYYDNVINISDAETMQFSSPGKYNTSTGKITQYYVSLNILGSSIYRSEMDTNGLTITNISSETNTKTVQLCI